MSVPPADASPWRSLLARALANKEARVVALFAGLNILLSLVGNRLLTQFVAPLPLGELYLFMTFAQWLTIPTAAGYLYVTRHWQVAQLHGAGHNFARVIGRALGIQVAIVAVGVAVLVKMHIHQIDWATGFALFAVSAALAIDQALEPIQSMERRRVTAGVLGLLGAPLRPFALLIAVVLWGKVSGQQLLGAQAAYSSVLAAAAIGALFIVLRQSKRRAAGKRMADLSPHLSLRSFLAFSIPSLVANVALQGCTTAERWGLAWLADPASTAIFVQALGISLAVAGAATTVLNIYYYPIITAAAAGNERTPLLAAVQPLRRYLVITALALVGSTLTFAVLAGPLTELLFGPKFAAVRRLLPWTMTGAALFQMGQAMAIVSITAREMVGQNTAYVSSRLGYLGALLGLGQGENPPLRFSRMYGLGNALYVGLMGVVCLRLFRRERRLDTPPAP